MLAVLVGMLALGVVPANAWTVGVVDPNRWDAPAWLAIGPDGRPAVAWINDDQDVLYFGHWNGSGWEKAQAASTGCLAEDRAVLGFSPITGQPDIVTWCSGGTDVGAPPDKVLWVERDPATLTWSSQVIGQAPTNPAGGDCYANGDISSIDLAYDPTTGLPSVVFTDAGTHSVAWLQDTGVSWQQSWIVQQENCNWYPGVSAAFDPVTGHLGVAFVDTQYEPLVYLEWNGSAWQSTEVDDPFTLEGPSLRFSPTGTPWLAYTGYCLPPGKGDCLMVAHRTAGVWSVHSVDQSTNDTGWDPSLAFNDGLPRVAYFEGKNKDLRLARLSAGRWSHVTVVSSGSVGRWPSLTFTAGKARITYWDRTNLDIRWVRA